MDIEFFFDVACPYSWLASSRMAALAAASGLPVRWRPIRLAQVLDANDSDHPLEGPMRAWFLRDLGMWADRYGLPFRPPDTLSLATDRALGVLCALPESDVPAVASRLFQALWQEGHDPTDPALLTGLVGAALVEEGSGAAAQARLAANTAEAMERRVFGTPTFFLGDALFFGNDRLFFLEGIFSPPAPAPVEVRPVRPGGPILDFFFDILSPYSYLAASQMERIGRSTGLPVRWRPFLLGGRPRDVSAWMHWGERDLGLWAAHYGIPFAFSKYFPIRSVLPMRVLTALPDDALPDVARQLLRALWVDGLDPSDPAVLTGLVGEARVAAAHTPIAKQRLRANSDEAAARGAFGTPTVFVGDEMFFGNDRLSFAEAAARRIAGEVA